MLHTALHTTACGVEVYPSRSSRVTDNLPPNSLVDEGQRVCKNKYNELAGLYEHHCSLLSVSGTVQLCGTGPVLLAANGDSSLAPGAGLVEPEDLSSLSAAPLKI